MSAPPARMRKGFDRTLARALKTTHDVLFRDYTQVAPEASAQVIFHPDQVYPLPTRPDDLLFWPYSNALREIIVRLHQDEEVKVAEYALQLVLAKNDSRRAEFEMLRDRAIMEAPSGKATTFPPEVVENAIAKFDRELKRKRRK